MRLSHFIIILLLLQNYLFSQTQKIIESNSNKIIIEFNFSDLYSIQDTTIDGRLVQYIKSKEFYYRNPGEPWIPEKIFNLGIPEDARPTVKILNVEKVSYSNKFIIPVPYDDPQFFKQDISRIDQNIYGVNNFFPTTQILLLDTYIMRFIKVQPISISIFQFNPVTRELIFNKKIKVQIDYNSPPTNSNLSIDDDLTKEFIVNNILNSDIALHWVNKPHQSSLRDINYWYNPAKNYFKVYLKEKGLYRITFEQLVNLGVPLGSGVPSKSLEMYNEGVEIPLDINDGNDSTFNSGDYFQFVGQPPISSPNAYLNIYNNTNVYWFSYQSDSYGLRYNLQDGYPTTWSKTYQTNYQTLHFEKDSLFERLGYASNDQRDFWFWQKANSLNGSQQFGFEDLFKSFENWNTDSAYVNLKVDMHGITNSIYCQTDHKAYIEITGQPIGNISWDGQARKTFEKKFYVSNDSIRIFPSGNILNVWVRGDVCQSSDDEIRINWYEFQYWRNNRTSGNNFTFKSSPGATGRIRYWLWNWTDNSMKVYVPSRNKIIVNPQIVNDDVKSILFVDNVFEGNEYFCASDNYFLNVDSIRADSPSDYRNTNNGADYIIISHPNFSGVAERLKSLRINDFPDTTIPNPRIFIADVNEIYDEFSNGLLDPYAIKDFIQYSFENWQTPAPTYVVLLGDMSYDYRKLLPTSRQNFIPSIPFFTSTYGIAASDNMFVAVAGSDLYPDLAIGRLSIENSVEGNILIDKLENYPQDANKAWKEKTLLIASGLSLQDEINFGFNEASTRLEDDFISFNGYKTEKVFRYPNKPEHLPFQGEGPKIREKFNEGCVLANYYGHGGGYQWDLVFTNDDIYLLQNDGRLPFIISVTCYTAHFDNQDVFGEQFNKIPGKGSIGFFGSSGLTYWTIGKAINTQLFNQIFNRRNFIIGKAILNAKNSVPGIGLYGAQIALLTNLSDPVLKLAFPDKPDFNVSTSDIELFPKFPLVGDTVSVQVKIHNMGPIFEPDSVNVELYANLEDTTFLISSLKKSSFADTDSVLFKWIPTEGKTYQLTFKINELNPIPEMDHSDNIATGYFSVFNLTEPNIVDPIDGFSSKKSKIKFTFTDVGEYIDKSLTYFIEIDTSLTFMNPVVSSGSITAFRGILSWTTPTLHPAVYFWRARIYDGENYGNWSNIRTIILNGNESKGFTAEGNALKLFTTSNMFYSELDSSLILNTSVLPPRPSNNTFIKNFDLQSTFPDSVKLNTITTDGTYIYAGTIWFYALNNNANGFSHIYKIGTGYNGTIEGQYYGIFSDFFGKIYNSIFYHNDGNIYVAGGNAHYLTRINVQSEQIDSVFIPDGILSWESGRVTNDYSYIKSDGNHIYNIASKDSISGNNKYVLRVFDTSSSNWTLLKSYNLLASTPYTGYTDFFAAKGYIYPTEYLQSNFMRRIRESDGFYEEEWIVYQPFQSYYSWCYDWMNNNIYAGTYRSFGYPTKISKFDAEYTDASGTVYSPNVGPAFKWNSVGFNVINNSIHGNYNVVLQGYNSVTKFWQDLASGISSPYNIDSISTKIFPSLRLFFAFSDSSLGASSPMLLKSVNFDYKELPEVVLNSESITINPDSLLQGLDTKISLNVQNIGHSKAEDLQLKYFLNNADSAFYSPYISINPDTSLEIEYVLKTNSLLFQNEIRVISQLTGREYFTFNNISQKNFYVSRDSINPTFNITFDGKEIINGDIISSEPEVVITLEDNSPLPLDSTYFTIVHTVNNIPKVLNVPGPDITYEYTPFPNSRAVITWKPKLADGRHVLEVLAKDASGNFFDSTSSRSVFNVFNNPDLLQVYNYPNPFSDNTYFTFELRGVIPPEEFKIKIFTVAGRLIKEMNIPPAALQIGFNKILWDGKDQDGDEVANGLYFYKILSKHGDEVKTVTQKLAKVK